MDLSTIVGIIVGFGLMAVAIFMKPGGSFFFKLDAFLIVCGGVIAATLINFPLKDFIGSIKVAKNAFINKTMKVDELIEKIVDMARRARVEGLLALEKDIAWP